MSWKTVVQKLEKHLFQMLIQENFKNRSWTRKMLWWFKQKYKQRNNMMNNMWYNHKNIMQSSIKIL